MREVRRLGLDLQLTSPSTFGHPTAVLCCVDAVLSINRPYARFVRPRVERFARIFPGLGELQLFRQRIEGLTGEEIAREFLDTRDALRGALLDRLTKRLLELAGGSLGEGEMGKLKRWALEQTPASHTSFGVPGIGIATFQYLRMLLGVDTVKPDTHVGGFVSSAVGRRLRAEEVILLVERSATVLGASAIAVDHAIWRERAALP